MSNLACNFFIVDGKISNAQGVIINRPSVFINVDENSFYSWGEYNVMSTLMNDYVNRCKQQGLVHKIVGAQVIDLSNLSVHQQYFSIRALMGYSGSQWISEFAENIGEYNDIQWLNEQMKKFS